jgi:hypothetical protein
VDVINTDGAAIIGPGSEWFWAAAQFVVVVVSLAAIQRQLRAQNASNSFAQLETLVDRWDSKLMMTARLRTAIKIQEEGVPTEIPVTAQTFLAFFEILDGLEERGHIAIDEIYDAWYGTLAVWWRLIGPAIEGTRAFEGNQLIWTGLERLNNECRAYAAAHGGIGTVQTRPLSDLIDQVIANLTEGLQLLHDVEANVMPRAAASTPAGRPT